MGREFRRTWPGPSEDAGCYSAIATEPYFAAGTTIPPMLGALGVVPATPLIDPEVMRATLADVLANWDWDSAWGWDFPVMAMTATRIGDPDTAIDSLLMDRPKNAYLPNGHNPPTATSCRSTFQETAASWLLFR